MLMPDMNDFQGMKHWQSSHSQTPKNQSTPTFNLFPPQIYRKAGSAGGPSQAKLTRQDNRVSCCHTWKQKNWHWQQCFYSAVEKKQQLMHFYSSSCAAESKNAKIFRRNYDHRRSRKCTKKGREIKVTKIDRNKAFFFKCLSENNEVIHC